MGLEVKIWDTSVKCSYAAIKFLNAYIPIVSRQKALIFRTYVYKAIFIQVHGHLCFLYINLKGSSGARYTFIVVMILLHSAMPSRVHICIAVFIDRSVFRFDTLQALIARIKHWAYYNTSQTTWIISRLKEIIQYSPRVFCILHAHVVYFDQMVDRIYPTELQLNRANSSDTEAPFLGFESMYI